MKKLLSIILIVFIFATSCVTAFVDDSGIIKDEVTVIVNGRTVKSDPPAHIKDGRTMLPFRAVGDELGCEVSWYADSQTVQLENGFTIVAMQIGNKKITVMNKLTEELKYYEFDVAPYIDNGRTFVPVRAITDVFGATIEWESVSKTVTIVTEYDKIEDFDSNDYARVKKDGKYGYIDKNKNIVIPVSYLSIEPIQNGYAGAKVEKVDDTERYFYSNYSKVNDEFVEAKHDLYGKLEPFTDGISVAQNLDNQKYVCIGIDGNKFPDEYDQILPFSNGYAFAIKDGKYYSINTKGVATEIKAEDESNYEAIIIKSNNFAIVKKTEMSDSVSDSAAELTSDSAADSDASEFVAPSDAKKVGVDKYGVINPAGNIIIDLQYKSPEKFIFDNVFTDVKTEEVTGENQEPQIKVTYTLWDNQKVYFTYPKNNVPEKGVVGVETPAGYIYYDTVGNILKIAYN